MAMRPYLQFLLGLGTAALLTASVGCAKSYRVIAEPPPQQNAQKVIMSVEPVKRYRDGKILDLNRLTVDWKTNSKCRALNYGDTTGYVLFDNLKRVLDRYPSEGVFQHGFEYRRVMSMRFSDLTLIDWQYGKPYVRESTEAPEMLMRIGQDIYKNACNDPEQKASATK